MKECRELERSSQQKSVFESSRLRGLQAPQDKISGVWSLNRRQTHSVPGGGGDSAFAKVVVVETRGDVHLLSPHRPCTCDPG